MDYHDPAFVPVPAPETLDFSRPSVFPWPGSYSPISHITVPITPPWGLTANPPGPSIIAPATPGPDLSVATNPSPAAVLTSLAHPGPDHRIDAAHPSVATPPGAAATAPGAPAPATGTATDPLVVLTTYMTEHIAQVVNLFYYLRFVQQPTITDLPLYSDHPETSLFEDYAANSFPVQVVPDHAPPFVPVPALATLYAQATVFEPGLDLTDPISHIPVPVTPYWGLNPNPP